MSHLQWQRLDQSIWNLLTSTSKNSEQIDWTIVGLLLANGTVSVARSAVTKKRNREFKEKAGQLLLIWGIQIQ